MIETIGNNIENLRKLMLFPNNQTTNHFLLLNLFDIIINIKFLLCRLAGKNF